MYGAKDVELTNRIGQQLLDVMPPEADSITAKARAGNDWARVSFEFRNAAGDVGHFSFEDNPDDAADEIGEALMELHAVMAANGRDDWNRAEFTTNRDGEFNISFSYEDEPDS
jgi:hypothetical protein